MTMRDEFESHRRLLEGIAYRMSGVLADAQDVVQETHIKWSAADRSTIRDPRAWLVTTCSRLAIDLMRSAHKRREHYVGTWLPEPLLGSEPVDDPETRTAIDDSVSLALMVALERLSPSERAVFILHDVFGFRFEEIGEIVAKTGPTCRKLASRARKAVEETRPRFPTTPEMHRRLHDAFFAAAHSGELERLTALFADSVSLQADGGGQVETAASVLHGPLAVAAFFRDIWRAQVPSPDSVDLVPRWFNGGPGTLLFKEGKLMVALSFTIRDGVIHDIFALRNPDKLAAFER